MYGTTRALLACLAVSTPLWVGCDMEKAATEGNRAPVVTAQPDRTPGTIPAVAAPAQVLQSMRDELGPQFLVRKHSEIFYVATDAGAGRLDTCLGTISRVEESLVRGYVKRVPVAPLKVYLLKDSKSYYAYCREKLDQTPATPYGFFLDSSRKLVMNISTGTGTLAHELVHPFIEADFPGAPAWFNEGFASLHEQSRWSDTGEMEGLVNWRLPGLQQSIRRGRCPTLSRLMSTTDHQFYGDNSGIHYALARYLCVYLQQNALLKAYYRAYRDEYSRDPTGRKILERIVGKPLPEIDADLRAWATTLRYQ